MKPLKIFALLFFAAALVTPMLKPSTVRSQSSKPANFVDSDPAPGALAACIPTEAPVGFDNKTNGSIPQGNPLNPQPGTFEGDVVTFEGVEDIPDGLGPIYNAQSCRECHQNTVRGGISQVTELRAGHQDHQGNFVPASVKIRDDNGNTVAILNRSLINDRAICPQERNFPLANPPLNFSHPDAQAQEHVPDSEKVTTFRTSLNLLGDGFVEAINGSTFQDIVTNQPVGMKGQIVLVPVLEAPDSFRIGRFGWKAQQASLLSFSGDAYINEMGITNRLFPNEFTTVCDEIPDKLPNAEDEENDIDAFTRFMRATKAPPRDKILAISPDGQAGADIFKEIGCIICHVPTITTAPAGTLINGGTFTVPPALGCKTIHPYGDFLLHNVGTGDGIVQTTLADGITLDQTTAQKMRTPPLWGVRTRDRLMHDGETLTLTKAILRHAGEATGVITNYQNLNITQKSQLITFLNSL
jgi:CxxC motif-containing protein (DUF1111 family)